MWNFWPPCSSTYFYIVADFEIKITYAQNGVNMIHIGIQRILDKILRKGIRLSSRIAISCKMEI